MACINKYIMHKHFLSPFSIIRMCKDNCTAPYMSWNFSCPMRYVVISEWYLSFNVEYIPQPPMDVSQMVRLVEMARFLTDSAFSGLSGELTWRRLPRYRRVL